MASIKHVGTVFLILIAPTFTVIPTWAAPIYSQVTPSEPTASFSSQDNSGSQKAADNFVLPGTDPITIRSLRFIGGYGLTASLL